MCVCGVCGVCGVCVWGGGLGNGKKGLEFLPYRLTSVGCFTGQGSRYAVARQLS